MKDNSFDFIKDKFENSGVNAPDDINEQLVLDKLEGDVPELTVLPPKQSKKKLVAGISAVAAAAVITAGALVFTSVLNQQTVAKPELKEQHIVAGLRGFKSRDEVKDTMRTVLKINDNYFGGNYLNNGMAAGDEEAYYEKYAADSAASGTSGSSSGSSWGNSFDGSAVIPNAGASTHNSTYVQHTGVDEADSAKTNGKYIFYLEDSGYYKNTIAVFSAEGEKTERIAEVSRPDHGFFIEFFMYSDRLVTVSKLSDDYYSYPSKTQIDVYDVSDAKSVKHLDSFFQSGSYVSSRMIGGKIYLVTNDYFIDEDYLPTVGSPKTASGDSAVTNNVPVENIFSVDTPMNNSFLVISVMDTDKGSRDTATKAIIGSGDDIYCNQQNLYVTALEYSETYYGNLVDYAFNNNVVYDDDVYLEKGEQSSSAQSDGDTEEYSVDSDGYKVDGDGFYHNDNEGKIYYGAYAPGDEPEPFAQWEPEHTLIIKVSLENGIDFTASGNVEGTVNNQYSLDESGGNLRVATTSYDREYNETNHLFILDKNLKQLGSVKDFAKNETIRAVRYINDTAYVITYMETDPLFVIDLSNPSAPQIKGEVKISGFSTMLVPVDDHTLLGIGYHTNDASSEGIDWNTQNALKLVTFDVTDMSSPKVLDTKIFPNCSSEVQYNPKALLVNFERGDYSIPYNYYKDYEYRDGAYRDSETPESRCGLINFRIDGGRINVIQDYTSKKFTSQYDTVTRCVYIGDYMYLIGEHYSLLDYYSSDSSGATGTDSDYYRPSEEIYADIEAVKYV